MMETRQLNLNMIDLMGVSKYTAVMKFSTQIKDIV